MPTPKVTAIKLTVKERADLKQLVRRHNVVSRSHCEAHNFSGWTRTNQWWDRGGSGNQYQYGTTLAKSLGEKPGDFL